jgi:hypothetical protein
MGASLTEPLNRQVDHTPKLSHYRTPLVQVQTHAAQRCIPLLSHAITLAAPARVPKQLLLLVLRTLWWE